VFRWTDGPDECHSPVVASTQWFTSIRQTGSAKANARKVMKHVVPDTGPGRSNSDEFPAFYGCIELVGDFP
jgi:hypothetical protein